MKLHCGGRMSHSESGELLLIPFDLQNTHNFLEVIERHTHRALTVGKHTLVPAAKLTEEHVDAGT